MAIKPTNETIDVLDVNRERATFHILGESPLICNAMSAKARQELLLPKKKMTAAEKAINLKHDPKKEFYSSIYRMKEGSETLVALPAVSFKKSIMGAALDIPGAKKTQIGRLCYVIGDYIPIYGIPELMMSIVRSADMNRTPDVRTRAILPVWATTIEVSYTMPMLNDSVITKLLAGAGIMQGVGDWRVEKGSGNYGTFKIVDPDDPRYKLIIETGGRQVQLDAMQEPQPYDSETEELLGWYDEELFKRGIRNKKAA